MTKLGFVGLGLMGNPMSRNLIKAGYEVSVWNRTTSRMRELVESGANEADSPRDVATRSEIIVTMVSDSADVEDVILGEEGIASGLEKGSVVIDMSTIAPSVTQRIALEIANMGSEMLDAPVSGGVIGATNGTLSIMVGGPSHSFERCRPVLEAMGDRITYCGEHGMGQVAKLANQVVGMGTIASVCEGLVFAARAGGDPEAIMSALTGGAANSWMLENLGPKIYDGDFAPGFMVDHAQKDLRLILESAAEMDLPLFLTPLINQLYRSVQQMGFGSEGTQAGVKMMEKLAGIEARSRP